MRQHPLIHTLRNLRGNARGCVLTEPMWGIPYNLYVPFASVYMLAFGLSDSQIGLVTSIGLGLQVLTSLISGAIADKLGRRRTTLIFDIVSWGIPGLMWAFAQDFYWFLAAAILNSLWRIVHTSWQCLVVEDTDPELLVDVWSWIYIAGLLAAFVSPLTGLIIDRFKLVPTMRALYLFAALMMTAKALTTNALVTETRQGQVRMRETRGQPLWAVLQGTPQVLRQLTHTPITLVTGGLIMVMGVYRTVQGTFWSILATQKLQVPAEYLALYPFARSITTMAFFFLVMPRLRRMDTRKPLLWGLLGLIASQALLVLTPARSYLLLLLATVIEGCSLPMAGTHVEKLAVIDVDARERARIMAILYTVVLLCTSPFGWIAGRISEVERSLPFVLLLAMLVVGVGLTYLGSRMARAKGPASEPVEQAVRA